MDTEHASAHGSDRHYYWIYGSLLTALAFSLALGAFVPTAMVIAWIFAIAVAKAGLVLYHFMHLRLEPRWTRLIVFGALAVLLAFLAGTADDIVMGFGRE
jgi:caa(3)-type oxidase subunit IV